LKKDGELIEKLFDPYTNQQKQILVRHLLQKDSSMDIFQKLVGSPSDKNSNYNSFLKYKFKLKTAIRMQRQLNMFMRMGLVSGEVFVRCLLLRISVAKRILLIEIE
jgi:hypothetical protein